MTSKSKALKKMSKEEKGEVHYSAHGTNHETPERQKANATLRKGMKMPKDGRWPVAH